MNDTREINEAIFAAEEALNYLKDAKKQLSDAGNWGLVDILGGGLFTTFVKHSKMDKAKSTLQKAVNAIRRLDDEMDDVTGLSDTDLDDDLLTFADYFFDNMISDLFVQSRIETTKAKVNESIAQVERILIELQSLRESE